MDLRLRCVNHAPTGRGEVEFKYGFDGLEVKFTMPGQ